MKSRIFTRNTVFSLALILIVSAVMISLITLSFDHAGKADDRNGVFYLKENASVFIKPFIKDDRSYLFLPSGIGEDELVCKDETVHADSMVALQDLPSLFIHVRTGDIETVNADQEKHVKARIDLTFVEEDGTLDDTLTGTIKGRGNTSWLFYDKKPYNITLDEPSPVLGMDDGRKWCLISESTDAYFFSNKLVYDLAKQLDLDYVPDCRFVNVYIDGEYEGLYLLTEKIEVGENRLDIDREDLYLLETDLNHRIDRLESYFITEGNNIVEIHYPNAVDASHMDTISREVQELEDALQDMESDRWQELIDIDSWARVYLLDELFENEDGGYCSVYFYKDHDGRFVRGPVWDYDRVLGHGPESIMAGNERKYSYEINVNYNYCLLQREEFRERVSELFAEEFFPLIKDYLPERAEELEDEIASSLIGESIRWDKDLNERKDGKQMVDLLDERISFLHDYFENEGKYCKVQIEDETGYLDNHVVLKGQTINEIKDLDEKLLKDGLYYFDSRQPFDENDIIDRDICLVRSLTHEQEIPLVHVPEVHKSIGIINEAFIVFFVFCFLTIIYIIFKRIKNGKIPS